jgi:hypothetical protein
MPYSRHKDADRRMASARKLVRVILDADDLYPPHRREFIKLALWKVTEAEAGKYTTRYRSRGSLEPGAILQHDHVFERAKLASALIAEPDRLDELLDKAVACTVTKDEHQRLTSVSRHMPHLDGWARYRAAGISVIDESTGEELALPDDSRAGF